MKKTNTAKYILGLHDGHNASAALSLNGKILSAVQEERFTGQKNQMGFPERAVRYLLKAYAVKSDMIGCVALSTRQQSYAYLKINRDSNFTVDDHLREMEEYWKPKLSGGKYDRNYWVNLARLDSRFKSTSSVYKYPNRLDRLEPAAQLSEFNKIRKSCIASHLRVPESRIIFLDHHSCHMYYSYYANPNRSKDDVYAGFTIDSEGDGLNQTVWRIQNGSFKLLAKSSQCELGRLYRMITLYLGMKPLEHEYKVMGLAPYAKKSYYKDLAQKLESIFSVRGLTVVHRNRPSNLYQWLKDNLQGQRFDNIAAAVQLALENTAIKLLHNIYKETRIRRFIFGGGVAMNVKLNKLLQEQPFVDDFFVCGSSSDESLSIGACYLATRSGSKLNQPLRNLYLGPSIDNQDIRKAITILRRSKKYTIKEFASARQIAKLLAAGEVVARVAGRMEFGARALGNRSIYAHPGRVDAVKEINEMIKGRDFWMPFALTVLDKFAKRYLENPKKFESRYMATCFDTKPSHLNEIKAGIHPYDHTVRPQILVREHNSKYYEIVDEFFKLTGIGALLNTSYNLHGLPMVNTIKDALYVFRNSGLRHLVIDNVLISKSKR